MPDRRFFPAWVALARLPRLAGAGLGLGLGVGLVAGCAGHPDALSVCDLSDLTEATAAQTTEPLTEVPLKTVTSQDSAFLDKLQVTPVLTRRLPSGAVEVLAQVVNCSEGPLQVEGRTQFFDQADHPLQPISDWRQLDLPPGSFETYQEFSVDGKTVTSYGIELRERH